MIKKIPIKIKKLRENAKLPDYKHNSDSGADLYVSEIHAFSNPLEPIKKVYGNHYTLEAFETILCKVGFSVEIEEGLEIQIRPTSGNSLKTPLRIPNAPGTIDAGYRGEIGVIIQNVSNKPYIVTIGDKIAQMVIANVIQADFQVVEELGESQRGTNGYGSTGIAGANK